MNIPKSEAEAEKATTSTTTSETSQSDIKHTSKSRTKKTRKKIIPDFLMPCTYQIAGHGSEDDGHRIFLKHTNGRILKPFQAPPKGVRETGFYQAINKSNDPIDVELRKWLPDYFGVQSFPVINGPSTLDNYLVLEDLTMGMELPNIMDIKIGSRTWGPDAPPEKQKHEDAKYKGTKMPLGFSILGIIVHPIRGDSDEMTKYDRSFGKNIRTDEISRMPSIYFDMENSGCIKELVEIVLGRLKSILAVMEKQRKYLMYASSVLFIYDAAAVRRFLVDGNRRRLEEAVNIKVIDFAHIFPAEGKADDNFLRGLRNLIKVFQSVLNECGGNPDRVILGQDQTG